MASDKEMNATYAFGLGARRGVAANDIVELVRRVAQTHNVDLREAKLCALHRAARGGARTWA
ncbi:MAG: Cobalamin (Vitamin B12) biosynthesis CbiG protein [Methylocystaceae bacterium]|nr:MAG: Cobalamin (Vitamin B12) biosynthesis CbiG protein [Methylocystaceae bacterium]